VALMTPGPVSDAGWNASAFEGLQLIKVRLHAETAQVQTASPADFADSFRDFGARHFNLVFAHGFEYTDAALKAAKDFPAMTIIISSGNVSTRNVASLNFRFEDATYLEGVLAGLMTRTGTIGAVGGIELPAIRLTFEGYRLGFLAERPDGKVLISYIGNFSDVGAAKEAALAQISRGADFVTHNADAAGLGVLQAAQERKVYAFGAYRDQNSVAPDATLASAICDIPEAFLKLATEVRDGTFKPGIIQFGYSDGMVRLVFNPRLEHVISPNIMAKLKQAEARLAAGQVKLPTLKTVQ
jgi:basic membrane protein A